MPDLGPKMNVANLALYIDDVHYLTHVDFPPSSADEIDPVQSAVAYVNEIACPIKVEDMTVTSIKQDHSGDHFLTLHMVDGTEYGPYPIDVETI